MEEIEQVAQTSSHGNADETGFRMKNGHQGWLWVLVTECAVLFRLFLGRGQKCASELLGCFAGILTTDRWCGYNHYPSERRQLCWAHLLRDFKAMCVSSSDGEAIGKALLKSSRLMFRMWHRFKKWKSTPEKRGFNVFKMVFALQMESLRTRIKALLEEGAKRGVPKCGTILKVEELLWTFTRVEGIEPTNNSAERAVRPAVLWKKRSFGVESERGGQYVESMLSIWGTSRRNGVNPIVFLRELIHSYRAKATTPSIFHVSGR